MLAKERPYAKVDHRGRPDPPLGHPGHALLGLLPHLQLPGIQAGLLQFQCDPPCPQQLQFIQSPGGRGQSATSSNVDHAPRGHALSAVELQHKPGSWVGSAS